MTDELKAQVEHLTTLAINCCDPEMAKHLSHELKLTARQCLNTHDVQLLNDIEQEFANGADIDFCDFFACYKINLELDK